MTAIHVFKNGNLAASAHTDDDGGVHVYGANRAVMSLLSELLSSDFNQMIGFPAVQVVAEKGTPDALNAVGLYLNANLGLDVIQIGCSVQAATGTPVLREAESEFTARAFIHAGIVDPALRRALMVFDTRRLNRWNAASAFGSQREFRRQETRAALLADPRRRRWVSEPLSGPSRVPPRLSSRIMEAETPADTSISGALGSQAVLAEVQRAA